MSMSTSPASSSCSTSDASVQNGTGPTLVCLRWVESSSTSLASALVTTGVSGSDSGSFVSSDSLVAAGVSSSDLTSSPQISYGALNVPSPNIVGERTLSSLETQYSSLLSFQVR
jgi:hypothetical protein